MCVYVAYCLGATGNQTGVMCRAGEKQLLMQLVQEYTPEGTRETKARSCVWVDIAKKMLIPTEVKVTEDAEETVVMVDYQRGRVSSNRDACSTKAHEHHFQSGSLGWAPRFPLFLQ